MKAQVLYNAQNDGVISGDDMQEFFLKAWGEYSISGKKSIPRDAALELIGNSLFAQERNSPSLSEWCVEMRNKYLS